MSTHPHPQSLKVQSIATSSEPYEEVKSLSILKLSGAALDSLLECPRLPPKFAPICSSSRDPMQFRTHFPR
eukprot:CAMPEP_0118662358 /NCGR_PEP_ID=MMETSP0785-20121206/16788_1 /TAXON_ID=91992 /ORGANISM="Bolidomonas pacifica, Strain CCMP 1866" /LENGTH=70 /DNA_ID=CAMNT_0006555895 /DNA_START=250 /DNA_END=462 /DNA_ORIENTATION=+